jgi:hypothetical protein
MNAMPDDKTLMGNCTVVSKDGDLSAVPGSRVENWATAS